MAAIINLYGTQKTLEASGASVVSGAFGQADDASMLIADQADYIDAVIALSVTFATAPAAGAVITLYARPLNIDGTNDTPIPDANFRSRQLGLITVDTINTIQYLSGRFRNVPREYDIYFQNTTLQTISSGWTLKATPVAPGTT